MCQYFVVMNLQRWSRGGKPPTWLLRHLSENIPWWVVIAVVNWGVAIQIKKSWCWWAWWRLSKQKFYMLQFLPLTSSKQLIENPYINIQCCLTPLSCILLNAPLDTWSTWHAIAIFNETVENNCLDNVTAAFPCRLSAVIVRVFLCELTASCQQQP